MKFNKNPIVRYRPPNTFDEYPAIVVKESYDKEGLYALLCVFYPAGPFMVENVRRTTPTSYDNDPKAGEYADWIEEL